MIPEEGVDAFVGLKVAFGAIDAFARLHSFCGQVLEDPVSHSVASVVREHVVGVGADIVESGKSVPHDLGHAAWASRILRGLFG